MLDLVGAASSRKSSNTIKKKSYPGGSLYFVGANSPTGFRRISARVVLFDEVDGYPEVAGVEGDQIDIGHHYIAMSRKEFKLPRASPIDYEIPDEPDS